VDVDIGQGAQGGVDSNPDQWEARKDGAYYQSHEGDQGRSVSVGPKRSQGKKHNTRRGPEKGQCRGRSNQEGVNYLPLECTFLQF
jgi:hypothetical protein